jgi:hypothetical protein
MQGIALTLAFLLEIVAFIAFAAAALFLPGGSAVHIAVGAVLLGAVIGFWGMYMAPKAPHKFAAPRYYTAKSLIYTVAAITLFMQASIAAGAWFVALALLDEAFLYKHNIS